MTAHVRTPLGKSSPAEKRIAKKYDFNCDCGEQWNTPGHIFWVCRMYCGSCGEVVEAE